MDVENKALICVVLVVAIFMYRQQTQINDLRLEIEQTKKQLEARVTAEVSPLTKEVTSQKSTLTRLDVTIGEVHPKVRELATKVNGHVEDSLSRHTDTFGELEKKLAKFDTESRGELKTLKKLADDLVLTAKKLELDVTALKKDTSDMTSVRTTVNRLDYVINDVSPKMRELTEKVSRMTQDNEETRRRLLQFRDEFTNLKHAFRDRNPIMDALNSFFDWITGSNRLRLN